MINWNKPGCKSESANFKVYTLTHQQPSSGSSNEIKWFEKDKYQLNNKSETYNHCRFVAFGPLIGII